MAESIKAAEEHFLRKCGESINASVDTHRLEELVVIMVYIIII